METIEAFKEAFHHEHDEQKHPSEQGFAAPLVIGIVSYAGALSLVLTCAALFSTVV
ncbi:MAG: hypothetical protein ACIARQ_15280 [Phycisphaerales bacterium JB061]